MITPTSKKKVLIVLFSFIFSTLGFTQNATTAVSVMNWTTQTIHSVLSLDTSLGNISLPAGRTTALQRLEMETPALLKNTLFSVTVDSSTKLGNSIEQGEISLTDLNKIIDEAKKTPPWFSRDLSHVSMNHVVSVSVVGSLFIRHTNAYTPQQPFKKGPSRPYTGIIIDARGKLSVHGEYVSDTLKPALFPKIWNTQMEIVYEKNIVTPEIASKMGIVYYTASTDEKNYQDKIGTDPLRITARSVFGNYRTDPIISMEDYLKILSSPENINLLAHGKVVILCDEKSLEPSPLGIQRDENYYVTRKEIEKKLAIHPVSGVLLQDDWEGLTLTIYDIRFTADTAIILPEETNRLDSIASALRLAGPLASFSIEGHTANVGKPEGEQILSEQRAKTIAEELSKRGIERERMKTSGFGGTRPIASNETDTGRSKNRRVEITIELTR